MSNSITMGSSTCPAVFPILHVSNLKQWRKLCLAQSCSLICSATFYRQSIPHWQAAIYVWHYYLPEKIKKQMQRALGHMPTLKGEHAGDLSETQGKTAVLFVVERSLGGRSGTSSISEWLGYVAEGVSYTECHPKCGLFQDYLEGNKDTLAGIIH